MSVTAFQIARPAKAAVGGRINLGHPQTRLGSAYRIRFLDPLPGSGLGPARRSGRDTFSFGPPGA